MAKKEHSVVKIGAADISKTQPRSAAYFDREITTDVDFAKMSLAVMGDLISGAISPDVGNSVCANGRNVLKVVEMKYKYGKQVNGGTKRTLELAG